MRVNRPARFSVSLSPVVLRRVEALARARGWSTSRVMADLARATDQAELEALREELARLRDLSRRHRGGANELARFARICRVSRVMQPYLDAIA